MTYNLNDNVKDSFDFQLEEHTYKMRYPTLEEIQAIQKTVKKEGDDSQAVMDELYTFIDPQDSAPPIGELMKKQNMKVIRNFSEMIRKEYGVE